MILAISIIYIIINFFVTMATDVCLWEEFFNPYYIYRIYKVNKIGAVMIMLVAHIFFIIPAICYWIYTLCTFGRD